MVLPLLSVFPSGTLPLYVIVIPGSVTLANLLSSFTVQPVSLGQESFDLLGQSWDLHDYILLLLLHFFYVVFC